jgi:hypothetical protein
MNLHGNRSSTTMAKAMSVKSSLEFFVLFLGGIAGFFLSFRALFFTIASLWLVVVAGLYGSVHYGMDPQQKTELMYYVAALSSLAVPFFFVPFQLVYTTLVDGAQTTGRALVTAFLKPLPIALAAYVGMLFPDLSEQHIFYLLLGSIVFVFWIAHDLSRRVRLRGFDQN